MNISTLIAHLQYLQAEHGDIAVDCPNSQPPRVEEMYRCAVDWPAGSTVLLTRSPREDAQPEPVVVLV